MSTDTASKDSKHRDTTKSDVATPDFPVLTVPAEGVAERRRQVGIPNFSCVETTPVQLDFNITLASQDTWDDLVNPTFRLHYRTIKRGCFVDCLLEALNAVVYERQSSRPTDAPKWDLTIEATAPEWRRLMMEHIVSDTRTSEKRANQAVPNLRQLLNSGLANVGAALAALDLIREYNLDTSADTFHEHIEDIPREEDD